jgi:hypothetical protein
MSSKAISGVLLALSVLLPGISTARVTGAGDDIEISFIHTVNGQLLQLNDGVYTNAHRDSFTISMYKYYISNIRLLNNSKVVYTKPESYHLINEAKPGSKEFTLTVVPRVAFTAIQFTIGVDSLHNVSGAQSGALDPVNAMFWDWNTGYIMAKMEGHLLKKSDDEITYHLGGFSGTYNVLRTVTIPLPEGNIHLIRLRSEIAEWFKSPNEIDFSALPVVTTEGKEAAAIADNYADMFTLDHAE